MQKIFRTEDLDCWICPKKVKIEDDVKPKRIGAIPPVPVIQIKPDGTTVTHPSVRDAAKAVGIKNHGNISQHIQGKRKCLVAGCKWQYAA